MSRPQQATLHESLAEQPSRRDQRELPLCLSDRAKHSPVDTRDAASATHETGRRVGEMATAAAAPPEHCGCRRIHNDDCIHGAMLSGVRPEEVPRIVRKRLQRIGDLTERVEHGLLISGPLRAGCRPMPSMPAVE